MVADIEKDKESRFNMASKVQEFKGASAANLAERINKFFADNVGYVIIDVTLGGQRGTIAMVAYDDGL